MCCAVTQNHPGKSTTKCSVHTATSQTRTLQKTRAWIHRRWFKFLLCFRRHTVLSLFTQARTHHYTNAFIAVKQTTTLDSLAYCSAVCRRITPERNWETIQACMPPIPRSGPCDPVTGSSKSRGPDTGQLGPKATLSGDTSAAAKTEKGTPTAHADRACGKKRGLR